MQCCRVKYRIEEKRRTNKVICRVSSLLNSDAEGTESLQQPREKWESLQNDVVASVKVHDGGDEGSNQLQLILGVALQLEYVGGVGGRDVEAQHLGFLNHIGEYLGYFQHEPRTVDTVL